MKAVMTSIDEEFEKAQVKAHTRVKRGKLERVKTFSRKGEKKGFKKDKIDPSSLKQGALKQTYDLFKKKGAKISIEEGFDGFKPALRFKMKMKNVIDILLANGWKASHELDYIPTNANFSKNGAQINAWDTSHDIKIDAFGDKGSEKRIKEYIETIKTPEGFTRKETSSEREDSGTSVEFSSPDVKVRFHISHGIENNEPVRYWGDTEYKSRDKWHTFDRVGVEASFYDDTLTDPKSGNYKKILIDPNAQIIKQIDRAKKRIDETANYVKVPTLGYSIGPRHKEEITNKLKAGGSHQFFPSGFGTAYTISARPSRTYGERVATKELSDFFGVDRLYISSYDAD